MRHLVLRLCLRRLLLLVAVTTVSTVVIAAVPGDPLAELALSGQASTSGLETIRRARGFDSPPIVRAADALAHLARFDLGESTTHQRPVVDVMAPRMLRSVLMSVAALALAWFIAALACVWQAWRPRTPDSGAVTLLILALQTLPDLVVALAVLSLLTALGISWGSAGSVSATTMAVASGVLATVHVPAAWQHLRTVTEARLGAPWISGLAARGVGRPRRWAHAVRASAAPLVSVMAIGFVSLLSAGLVVETLFAIPGLGTLMLDALLARDLPLALGGVVASAASALAVLTLADIAVLHLDPRATGTEASR